MYSFDFDDWHTLAKTDPEAFERRRQREIQKLIASAPDAMQGRLESLQWRIDRERERHPSPAVACQKVFEMMWDRVYGDGGLLVSINQLVGPDSLSRPLETPSARIIPLHGTHSRRTG